VAAGTPLGSDAFVEADARSRAETVAGLVTALASLPLGRPAKSPSSVRARAPRRPKDSTDIGTKGRAEDTCRYARRCVKLSKASACHP
jgi:hypothetical protein